MNQDVSYMLQVERDQNNTIDELAARLKASTCQTEQEILSQQLEMAIAQLRDCHKLRVNTRQL